jgi:3-deoxy-D-manno-octulosonic-acid transferase
MLRDRVRRGKEDPARLGERMGRASLTRPEGPLVWIHGASVGESLSALPIIERLQAQRPGLSVLVTSGTKTSAQILARRLPPGAFHQYLPIDHPRAIKRFLDHWRPQAGLIMESELWPNLLMMSAERGVSLALLNARMSERSFNRWLRAKRVARALLSAFDICLAQDTSIAGRLESLGAHSIAVIGNLKYAAPPLPADDRALDALRCEIGPRMMWLAASTHPGEEILVGHVHAALKESYPSILTLVAPRHPERGAEIAALLTDMGHKVALRSQGSAITAATDIYLADTIGELGVFYRLADIVFMGGSLVPHGGQNPLEPARLNCAILYGPHTENFFTIYRELAAAGAATSVIGRDQLVRELCALTASSSEVERMAEAAFRVCAKADGVIARAMMELEPLLAEALGPPPTGEDGARLVASA